MRPMNHPEYRHQPHDEARKAKQRETLRLRLGIPEGHRRVYGVHVPSDIAETLRPLAAEIAAKHGFERARDFVEDAQSHNWEFDPAKTIKKAKASIWTDERRKAASEASKARWAKKHAEDRARWEAERRKPENRLRQKLFELRQRNEQVKQIYWETKAQIDELEAAEKLINQARVTLSKYGLAD